MFRKAGQRWWPRYFQFFSSIYEVTSVRRMDGAEENKVGHWFDRGAATASRRRRKAEAMLVLIEKAISCEYLCGERIWLEFEQGAGRVNVGKKFASWRARFGVNPFPVPVGDQMGFYQAFWMLGGIFWKSDTVFDDLDQKRASRMAGEGLQRGKNRS